MDAGIAEILSEEQFAKYNAMKEEAPPAEYLQTWVQFLGETHGRSDYVHNYEGPIPKSVVTNKYKFHFPAPEARLFNLPSRFTNSAKYQNLPTR